MELETNFCLFNNLRSLNINVCVVTESGLSGPHTYSRPSLVAARNLFLPAEKRKDAQGSYSQKNLDKEVSAVFLDQEGKLVGLGCNRCK